MGECGLRPPSACLVIETGLRPNRRAVGLKPSSKLHTGSLGAAVTTTIRLRFDAFRLPFDAVRRPLIRLSFVVKSCRIRVVESQL